MNEAYWDAENADRTGYIYITPLLTEVDRVKEYCSVLDLRDPQPIVGGRKLDHFNSLIGQGKNIAATHSLFSLLNTESHDLLLEANYTLAIDEETECVRQYPINKDDLRALFSSEMVSTDEYNKLCWNHLDWPNYQGKFNEVRNLCDNGNLVLVNSTLLIWEFPIKFLKMFKHVFILTYLFEGSLLSTYLKAHELEYDMKSVRDGRLVDHTGDDVEIKQEIAKLVNLIDEPKLNAVGTPKGSENPLSSTWYQNDIRYNDCKGIEKLQRNTQNYFKNIVKGKSSENMWSVFNEHKPKLKGRGYTTGFTACNLRATNEYRDKKNLAYLVNVFIHPYLVSYFNQCKVTPDQELYALSQLVQWIWRSQVRDGKPINLYLPSQRMRKLFTGWVAGKAKVATIHNLKDAA